MSRPSASTPAKETLVVLGTRGPRTVDHAPGRARSRLSSRSRRAASRAASVTSSRAGDLGRARPKPTAPATFSVPARRLRSCDSAAQQRLHGGAPAHVERAHALAVRRSCARRGSGGRSPRRPRPAPPCPPPARRRSGPGRPRLRPCAAASATGCRTPVSLLASITRHRAVPLVDWARRRVEVDPAVASPRRTISTVEALARESAWAVLSTAWCSIAETTSLRRGRRAAAARRAGPGCRLRCLRS